ncbi:MAG: hypothetical protein PHH85_01980 [Candidatus Methanoperedens sp.]|nr:hypothetical protein [Candidatus Methanoperedens sp.]
MKILDNNNNIVERVPELRSGRYEIQERYPFKPFEIAGYKDIDAVKRLVMKLDFTDKIGHFKFRMCFLFENVDGELRRIASPDFHTIGWFGRLKPNCNIDKLLIEGA